MTISLASRIRLTISILLTEVLAVILSDIVFFLQESNQKYTFFSLDNKVSININLNNYNLSVLYQLLEINLHFYCYTQQ